MKNLFLVLVALTFCASASATTILDFDAQTPSSNFRVVAESGFEILGDPSASHFISSGGSSFCSPACPDNGTNHLLSQSSSFTIRSEDDSVFTLNGFEGAEAHVGLTHVWADAIRVTGYTVSGSVIQDFILDNIQDGDGGLVDFESFTLGAGFEDLTHVVFSGIGNSFNWFSIDAIAINGTAVPAPAGLFFLIAGLVGLRITRR